MVLMIAATDGMGTDESSRTGAKGETDIGVYFNSARADQVRQYGIAWNTAFKHVSFAVGHLDNGPRHAVRTNRT